MTATAHETTSKSPHSTSERILVLDFGSQYAQLIARRVREQNVFCEIVRHDITPEQIANHKPAGLILSGGPSSVYESEAPKCDPGIFKLGSQVRMFSQKQFAAFDSLRVEMACFPHRDTVQSDGRIDNIP